MSFLNQLFGGDLATRAARAGALVNGDYSGAMQINRQSPQQEMNVATGLEERERGLFENIGNLIRGHPAGMGTKLPMSISPDRLPQLQGPSLDQFGWRGW